MSGSASLASPIVQVEDENRRPVAGAAVTFLLPNQGAGASFANGSQSLTITTDAQGRAVARGLRPNNVNGEYQIRVNAVSEGRTATATISQSNAITAAAAAGGISAKVLAIIAIAGGAACRRDCRCDARWERKRRRRAPLAHDHHTGGSDRRGAAVKKTILLSAVACTLSAADPAIHGPRLGFVASKDGVRAVLGLVGSSRFSAPLPHDLHRPVALPNSDTLVGVDGSGELALVDIADGTTKILAIENVTLYMPVQVDRPSQRDPETGCMSFRRTAHRSQTTRFRASRFVSRSPIQRGRCRNRRHRRRRSALCHRRDEC
jgi:hypothetical protein